MSELLLNTIIDKLTMQYQDIETIKERIETLPDSVAALKGLQAQLTLIEKNIQKVIFPEKEIRQLSIDLNRAISILQQPLKNEVAHHHHVPKLLWITAGLFLILCLVCSGWHMTTSKLENYIAGDTKYRYLKLDTEKTLKKILLFTDSLYFQSPKMRDDIIEIEEENKERSELEQQADEKQKEANALKAKASHQKQ